jgi:sugar phosphate isomerase/epimerase
MKLGYNTNGLAHHRLVDAIDFLAHVGYQSVAVTLDAGALDPFQDPERLKKELRVARERLDQHGMARVVETGARYLLNPLKKHDPTLLDSDPLRRELRVDFLKRSIDIAVALDAPLVSLWSGVKPAHMSEDVAFEHLVASLSQVLSHAEQLKVSLGFEPEPGMLVDTLARFRNLIERVSHPLLKLTLDVGHVHCNEEGPIADHVKAWGDLIANVHIEDMVRGVHEHLPFGKGTMEYRPILQALRTAGYTGSIHVELSRDSHRAVEAVCESYNFLHPLMRDVE